MYNKHIVCVNMSHLTCLFIVCVNMSHLTCLFIFFLGAESADIKIGANTLCEVTDLAPPLGVLVTFLIVTLIIIAVLIILLVREKYRSCSKSKNNLTVHTLVF